MPEWIPDVLGDEFEQCTLPLAEDHEGPVVATLVRAEQRKLSRSEAFSKAFSLARGARDGSKILSDVDVLYVHGWSDYFFQKRLARFWTARGARFFALDLRKYGRSIRPGQTPGYVADLATYDEDIDAAIAVMRSSATKPRKLILLGHSTGGLVLSLWAARHPDAADALVLNSPWLEFQLGPIRAAIAPMVELQARLRPFDSAPNIDLGFYARAQAAASDADDPVDINLDWRPAQSMAVHAGWLNAILAGHNRVAAGLNLTMPVCVLLSSRSALPTKWSEELTMADSVLVVDNVARAALKVGSSVTVERIDGALHDVFLSRRVARDDAYRRLERWVLGWVASRDR